MADRDPERPRLGLGQVGGHGAGLARGQGALGPVETELDPPGGVECPHRQARAVEPGAAGGAETRLIAAERIEQPGHMHLWHVVIAGGDQLWPWQGAVPARRGLELDRPPVLGQVAAQHQEVERGLVGVVDGRRRRQGVFSPEVDVGHVQQAHHPADHADGSGDWCGSMAGARARKATERKRICTVRGRRTGSPSMMAWMCRRA